ncbi:MAG: hypothetical protein Q8O19_02710 [Rectinemataceae bacterium]|nr:hypothetical protein [Rectinemataceae bacterium]
MKRFGNAFLLPVICLPVMASYPIRMGRPDKVGSVLLIQGEGKQSIMGKGTVGGQPMPFSESTITIALTYQSEVLEANDSRKATKLKLTLGKGKCQVKGVPIELPPEGTVTVALRKNDKKLFLKDGLPLEEPLQEALGIVVELGDGKDEEDLQFGTNTPKEVGDTWDVNGENILNIAGREIGLVGDPKNVKGKSRLDAILKHDGVDCMKISTHADIRDVKGVFYLDKDLGLKINKVTGIIDQIGLFPVDTELQPHTSHGHFKFDIECSGEVGEKEAKAPIEVKLNMEYWVDHKMTVVPSKDQKMTVLRKD